MKTIDFDNGRFELSAILSPQFSTNGFSPNALKAILFLRSWYNESKHIEVSTSGTTGKPKTISLPKSRMIKSAEMTAEAVGLAKGDEALLCLNVDYIGGIMMLVRTIVLDLQLTVVEPSSNPFAYANCQKPFDFIALVPLQLQNIINQPLALNYFNQSGVVLVGGAVINLQLMDEIYKLKPSIYSTYGMTETISHIALQRLNGVDASTNYEILPEVTIGQDRRGCLTINSPTTGNETVVTNDCVELINTKSFRWLGRIDNVINSGGIKIHLEELEEVIKKLLLEIKIDVEIFLNPIKDEALGQSIVLYLEGRQTVSIDLGKYLKEHLGFKSPKSVIWIAAFIRTRTGKINRQLTVNEMD